LREFDELQNRAAAGAAIGAGIGALAGLAATGNLRDALIGGAVRGGGTPTFDSQRVNLFYSMLREGNVPTKFWGVTHPPVRVRVILQSTPTPAALYINSVPTNFMTVSDLYMLPDDILISTLEAPGFAPCRVADAIIPGLQQPDGQEALTVRCNLVALKAGHKNSE
jgi:hypothetical protein